MVDNVPLVAGAMGMYDIVTPDMLRMAADPALCRLLCAGRALLGASCLLRRNGRKHADHWLGCRCGCNGPRKDRLYMVYEEKISWLAVIGYLAGAGVYWLQAQILHG
ncbi:MAG: hypothetical protein MZV63_01855 [Marinilabiliales bacterium]|nr:hypothetical protein [Marinilabiliales bacterium]